MYGRFEGNLIFFILIWFELNTTSGLLATARNSLKPAMSGNITRNCDFISCPIVPILSHTMHNGPHFR